MFIIKTFRSVLIWGLNFSALFLPLCVGGELPFPLSLSFFPFHGPHRLRCLLLLTEETLLFPPEVGHNVFLPFLPLLTSLIFPFLWLSVLRCRLIFNYVFR